MCPGQDYYPPTGLSKFNGQTGTNIGVAAYSRGATEPMMDNQGRLYAGFMAFNGIFYIGSYDTWDSNLNHLSANWMDYTTSRATLMPDGWSTLKLGYLGLGFRGAYYWDLSGSWSSLPSTDNVGKIYIGTPTGVACLNANDGSTKWSFTTGDTITTQPVISNNGLLYAGANSGNIYAFGRPSSRGVLSFPLKSHVPDRDDGYTSSTAPVNSVFDHSMADSNGQYGPYKCDQTVAAFTGLVASHYNPDFVFGCRAGYTVTPDPHGPPISFLPYMTYRGGIDGGSNHLYYDGHTGVDYQASYGTQVFASVTGTVYYPRYMVDVGYSAPAFHVMEIIPDHPGKPNPDYIIYYLHLKTYKGQQQIEVRDRDPLPGCQEYVSLPIPEGQHVQAGCLVAQSGNSAPYFTRSHLHFEVQKVVPPSAVLCQFGARAYAICRDPHILAVQDCVPVDPYGWTGNLVTNSSEIGVADSGDPYQQLTGIASEFLWK